jgi:hypothetical protein
MLYIGQVLVGTEALVSDTSFRIPDFENVIPNKISLALRSLCVTHGLTLRIDYGAGALLITADIVFPIVFSAVRRNLVHAYSCNDTDYALSPTKTENLKRSEINFIANNIVDVVDTALSLFRVDGVKNAKLRT